MSSLLSPSGHQPPGRLMRNMRKRLIGGVCAGIADFTGLPVLAVRLGAVVLLLASLPIAFFIYLIAWNAIPKPATGEMPDVSRSMRRKLRRIERRLDRLHKGHDPELVAIATEAFNAVRLLAPRLEGPQAARLAELRETALSRFPSLIDNLAALPPDAGGHWRSSRPGTPERLLVDQLLAIRDELQRASLRVLEQDFAGMSRQATQAPAMSSYRDRLEPLQARLARRGESLSEALATLASIESRLDFLLARIDAGADTTDGLDLRPFEVRKIAFEYLPDALERFLQLPETMAAGEKLADGRTATQVLAEQLLLLDTTLADLARSYYAKDARSLLVHGRFLREKFAEQPLHFTPPGETVR